MDILRNSNGLLIKSKHGTLTIQSGHPNSDLILARQSLENLDSLDSKPTAKKISWPGEYEVAGISVMAIPYLTGKKDTENLLLYILQVEAVKICFIPEVKQSISSEIIEKIGDIDLLILPAEKDTKHLSDVLEEITPKALLFHSEVGSSQEFETAKKLSLTPSEPTSKLTLTKSSFSVDKVDVFLLN